MRDWGELRRLAEAAAKQMEVGPQEWPGRPSRQRLELFLAASPETILELLAERERLTAQLGHATDTLVFHEQEE